MDVEIPLTVLLSVLRVNNKEGYLGISHYYGILLGPFITVDK